MVFYKILKKIKLLIILLLAFVIGFTSVFLVYHGVWDKFVKGLSSIHFLVYLLLFIFTFYLTLTIHELGHFLSFYFQKIKLRALYLTIFIFYKDQKGWHFTIKPKLWYLLGGLVVPDLGSIDNDDIYQNKTKIFAKSLITAPIVTILFLVLMVITFILSLAFIDNYVLIGFISITTFYTIFLSTLYIYSFTLSNQVFYGDFVAYKKMKTDEIFKLAQINQYQMFVLNEDEKTNYYLWNKTKEKLKEINITYSLFHMMLLIFYLDGVIKDNYEFDHQIDLKIRKLNLRPILRKEEGLTLAYEIANYYYKLKDVHKAYQIFHMINEVKNDKLDPKLVLYLKRKNSHIMHIEYHDEFLNDKNNFYIGQISIFEVILDPYLEYEKNHEKLEFVKYETVVDLVKDVDIKEEEA